MYMSERSQEHLSNYLNSESTSAGCLDFIACHGFLTAIVVRDDEYDINDSAYTQYVNLWTSDKEGLDQLQWNVQMGVEAEKRILDLQDYLLTTMHPDPPVDAEQDHRHESTFFKQTKQNIHPAALVDVNDDEEYCCLCNAVIIASCPQWILPNKRVQGKEDVQEEQEESTPAKAIRTCQQIKNLL